MNISDKYKYQTDVEHVLSNAGMYLGSTDPIRQEIWLYEEGMTRAEIDFHPALYKIIDEPLTNCYDHYVRSRESNFPVTAVRITLTDTNVIIQNDGSPIDIDIHPELGVYIPEMVFGHLRTSTNYGSEDKIVGGKHGLGVKLTAVWSSLFSIEVVDCARELFYSQIFRDNLQIEAPKIKKQRSKANSVKISFVPDFARFGMDQFPAYMGPLVKKRLYDFALLAPEVKFYFNGAPLVKRTFKNYITACLNAGKFAIEERTHWKIAAGPSDSGFTQISFVNGIHTLLGGRHIEHVSNILLGSVRDLIKKRKGISISLKLLREQLFLFVACNVVNPSFSGQVKESLIGGEFAAPIKLSDEFIEKTFKYIANASCAILNTKEKIKRERQDLKVLSESNGHKTQSIKGIPELTDANWAGSRRSKECILIVCEGESAATGVISGLKSNDRDTYGVYPLRGKLFNPQGKGADKIAANKVISDLKKVIGLESGKTYSSVDRLRYGKIVFMTDQDLDGHHIKALGLNVFYSLWPSLLSKPDFIGFIPTPIIKVTKGTKQLSFFYENEFAEWLHSVPGAESWTVKYYKGLGTSTAADFKNYFKNVKVVHFELGSGADGLKPFEMAFSKGASNERKAWLEKYDKNLSMTISPQNQVSYKDFINNELIHFSKYDCDRSIPSIDGLKISQRKILYTAFKSSPKETKVAQFCGRVAEMTHYHHGEGNLEKTIVGMAQNFVGSNNVNLLLPLGQFGSRRHGGEDSASGRYIFTQLNKLTRLIFRPEDDPILEYTDVNGEKAEPVHYMPIVPLVLVNGAVGIGTGFSCTVLPHNLRDIVKYIKNEIQEEPQFRLKPFFCGFNGRVQKEEKNQYSTAGIYTIKKDKILITELPVGTWTIPYKKHLESLIDSGLVKNFNDLCTDTDVVFEVFLNEDIEEDDIVKIFKLKRAHHETNMYLFDFEEKLRKFDTTGDIVSYYMPIREEYYEKRKQHMLKELESKILVARNKATYIQDIAAGHLNVFQKKDSLSGEMELRKYDKVENSYSYLFRMHIDSLCEDNATKLIETYKNFENELLDLQSTEPLDMWLRDLEDLERHL